MAELNSPSPKVGNRRYGKRATTRVNLTAMVDLAFLLITFFMLTTSLAKSKAMSLTMPDDTGGMAVPESRTLTVCLGKNNKALCYLGLAGKPTDLQVIDFSKTGIRKTLIETEKQVNASTGKDMLVLVKAGEHGVYDNLVNTLDEINISQVQRYAIVDIRPEDIALMKQKGIY